jgi:hypothetical protein
MYEDGGSFSQARVLCHDKKALRLVISFVAGSGLFGIDCRHARARSAEMDGVARKHVSQAYL